MRLLRYLALVILPMTLGGCSMMSDDLDGCPQLLLFDAFEQTPCQTQHYYPADVKQLRVYVFDDADRVVDTFEADDVTLTADKLLTVPFDREGDFTFVAWAAADFSGYTLPACQTGVTTRSELSLALDVPADGGVQAPAALYVAEQLTPLSRCHCKGTQRDTVGLSLQQLTNRINLTVYGLDSTANYSIYMEGVATRYDFGGQPLASQPQARYVSPVDRQGSVARARFNTLRLMEHRGLRLVVHDDSAGEEAYAVNLVDDIIMYRGIFGVSPYSLECDHDFNVVLVLERVPGTRTYVGVRAIINDWNVVLQSVNPY